MFGRSTHRPEWRALETARQSLQSLPVWGGWQRLRTRLSSDQEPPAGEGAYPDRLRLDSELPLDSRQARIAQTGPVVLPPHIAVNDPTHHPIDMPRQQGNLKGRLRGAPRRRFKVPAPRRLEATPTVVRGASLQEHRGSSQPFSRVDCRG